MRIRPLLFFVCVALTSPAAVAQAGASYKVTTATASAPGAPAPLQPALAAQGYTVASAQGAPLAQIWLARAIPARQASAAGEVAFPGLGTGAFIGVARFAAEWSDFRGQRIGPGTYTLRYALHPEDGNHMGVSAYRDFLLLVPAAQDTFGTRELLFNDLVKLSKLASSKPHPAVLSLVPATGQTFPAIVTDSQGHVTLELKLDTSVGGQPQALPIGLTLVGKSEAQ